MHSAYKRAHNLGSNVDQEFTSTILPSSRRALCSSAQVIRRMMCLRGLFAPALAGAGLRPDRVIYAETWQAADVLPVTE